MKHFLRQPPKQERGAALVEYAILLGLVSVVSITAVVNLGTEVNDTYVAIETALDTELDDTGGGTDDDPTPVDPNAPTGPFDGPTTGPDRDSDPSCTSTVPASYDGDACVDVGDNTGTYDATAAVTARMRFYMQVDNYASPPLIYNSGSNADLITIGYNDVNKLDGGDVHGGVFDLGSDGGYNEVNFTGFTVFDEVGYPTSTDLVLQKCSDGSEYTAMMHNSDSMPSEIHTFTGRIDRITVGGVVIQDEDIPAISCGGGGGPFGGF